MARDRVQTETPGRTGRPRSARVDGAIVSAAAELLAEGGFAAMNMEALAARAGVSKRTVYLRYASPAEVAVALVGALDDQTVAIPDTGGLRGDFHELALGMVALINDSPFGRIAPALLASVHTEPKTAAAVDAHLEHRREVISEVMHRAVERGELSADADRRGLLDALLAPFYFRLLVTREPIDEAFAHRAADAVFDGATAVPVATND